MAKHTESADRAYENTLQQQEHGGGGKRRWPVLVLLGLICILEGIRNARMVEDHMTFRIEGKDPTRDDSADDTDMVDNVPVSNDVDPVTTRMAEPQDTVIPAMNTTHTIISTIHRNITPPPQRQEVRNIKPKEANQTLISGNIRNHITVATNCTCREPMHWTAQAGQDKYIWQRVLQPQGLCCQGIYVEFGARNGIDHSNTYTFEYNQKWQGLLAEVDDREIVGLRKNRPRAHVIHGPMCPSSQTNVTILLSKIAGWTGSVRGYEPTRLHTEAKKQVFPCHYLVEELKKRGWYRVDYMTVDTEGSEWDLVFDFPWNQFDVRIVQIEQLNVRRYPAQRNRKEQIIRHLQGFGYELLSIYVVAQDDTDDIIMTRNVSEFLHMTTPHPVHDIDYQTRTQQDETLLPQRNANHHLRHRESVQHA